MEKCEICRKSYSEDDLDLVDDKWMCRNCEDKFYREEME